MSTQTVQAGGGNWSSAGTWSTGVPAAGDDVVLNSSSGQLTIDTNTNTIRSFIATGYTGTITHNAAVTLNIGGAVAPASNTALIFAGTYTINNATTSAIAITDTSAATNTYNFNNQTLGNVTINNGTTTTTQLVTSGFSMGATATLTLTQGGLDLNSQTVTIGLFVSSNTNTRTISLETANITISGTGGNALTFTTTNLTFSGVSSTITFTGASAQLGGSGLTFGTVNFTGSGNAQINSSTTYTNLTRTGTALKTDALLLVNPITVTGTLTITGNSVVNRILLQSNLAGISRTITCNGTTVVSNTDFQDIVGAGTANWNLSGISGLSGDCGGNSGITFTPAVTQTWQGSVGTNWSTNLWTTRTPLPQDNVNISEEFQAVQTITADMPRLGKNINFTGTTGNPTFSINVSTSASIFGSLTLISQMVYTVVAGSTTLSGRGSNTITTGGLILGSSIIVNTAATSSYTQNDNFATTGNSGFTLTSGTWNANGMNFTATSLSLNNNNTKTLNMGSGTWLITTQSPFISTNNFGINFNGTSTIINPGTSTLILNNAKSWTVTFAGNSYTFGNVILQTNNGSGYGNGAVLITGNNTFNSLTINPPNTVFFTNGSTTICNQFTSNGSASANIVLRSTINNYNWYLNVLAGYSVSNTDLRDSNASGSAILP